MHVSAPASSIVNFVTPLKNTKAFVLEKKKKKSLWINVFWKRTSETLFLEEKKTQDTRNRLLYHKRIFRKPSSENLTTYWVLPTYPDKLSMHISVQTWQEVKPQGPTARPGWCKGVASAAGDRKNTRFRLHIALDWAKNQPPKDDEASRLLILLYYCCWLIDGFLINKETKRKGLQVQQLSAKVDPRLLDLKRHNIYILCLRCEKIIAHEPIGVWGYQCRGLGDLPCGDHMPAQSVVRATVVLLYYHNIRCDAWFVICIKDFVAFCTALFYWKERVHHK